MARYTNRDIPAVLADAIRNGLPAAARGLVRINNVTIMERPNGDIEVLSYATRMAYIKRPEGFALVNRRKYSVTTSKQMTYIQYGLSQASVVRDYTDGEPPVR